MPYSIYIVKKLNAKDCPKVNGVCDTVRQAAQLTGTHICETPDQIGGNTIVIAVGGDGTVLEAMRIAVHNAAYAVLGVNLGQVGFLADFIADDWLADRLVEVFSTYDQAHPKQFPVETRMALETYWLDDKGEYDDYIAFNEVVVSNRHSDTYIKYHLQIDDIDAGYHRANSLIIGTPTGSTAYTLSAGGGLMLPTMQAIQIVPVAPLSLTSRPIIVPGDAEITVTVETDGEWSLKGDGNIIRTGSTPGTINVRQSIADVELIHPLHWNFFDMLTQKLGWKGNGL
jgi:NAD+ kinase